MATTKTLFRVTCAGIQFRQVGDKEPSGFALHGQHVELDATVSARLIALDCVRAQGDPDPVPQAGPVSGDPDNPYGGIPLVDPVQHAKDAAAGAVTSQAAAGAKPSK